MRGERRATSRRGSALRPTLAHALAVVATVAAISRVDAGIVYQSAGMGSAGRVGGTSVGAQLVGWRFHVDATTVVGSIGGHLGRSTGNMFGAIVALGGKFPAGPPLDATQVVASTVFDAGFPSSDVQALLSATLPPGDYALVFGSWLFGAGGTSFMPANNSGGGQDGSFFFASSSTSSWQDSTTSGLRFVIDSEPCTVCAPHGVAATPGAPGGTPRSPNATPTTGATVAPTATIPGGTPPAATPTPAPPVETPGPSGNTGVAPTATPDGPDATTVPSSNISGGSGSTPGSTSVPSPGGTPVSELPLMRKAARKCQSAVAAQARSYAQALHAALQRCFDRMLVDVFEGIGTRAATRGCATILKLSSPTSKISRKRSKALATIVRRCKNLAPSDIGAPCDTDAATIKETAECVLESHTLRVSEEVADTYPNSCVFFATAELPEVFAGVCSPDE